MFLRNAIVYTQYSDIQDGEAGVSFVSGAANWLGGNIDLDPLFVNQTEFNYRLQEGSPCIDSGLEDISNMNLPPDDLDGFDRIQDGDGNGSAIIDMGCYEFGSNPVKSDPNSLLPNTTILNQNYPNPFNPTTTISFTIQKPGLIDLTVINLKGQKIRSLKNKILSAGKHYAVWDGKDDQGNEISSGVYFFKLNGDDVKLTRKCLLLK